MNILIPDADHGLARSVAISLKIAKQQFNIIGCFCEKNNLNQYTKYIDIKILLTVPADEKKIQQLIDLHSIDIVLPVSVAGVKKAILYKNIIQKPMLADINYFNLCHDKYHAYKFFIKCNIKTPQTILLKHVDEVTTMGIIKPKSLDSGANIHLVKNNNDLLKYKKIYKDHIYQEYIEGHDVCCNVFCANGEIIAYTIQKPFSVVGFSPACSRMSLVHDSKILNTISRLMKYLCWNGVANIDLRYDKNNTLYVLEVNPRFWAASLVSTHGGVNFPQIMANYNVNQKHSISTSYKEINYIPFRYLYTLFFYKNTRNNLIINLCDTLFLIKTLKHLITKKIQLFFSKK